jgi:hypothetical protein
MVTLVPAAASALVEAALELLEDDSLELELELELDEPVVDLSPDEQPARPATTIAAPPTAISKPCFTSVLLVVGAIHQDQRIVPRIIGRVCPVDRTLPELPGPGVSSRPRCAA